MPRPRISAALIFALLALLGACGKKGALYLPDQPRPSGSDQAVPGPATSVDPPGAP